MTDAVAYSPVVAHQRFLLLINEQEELVVVSQLLLHGR
jgi:hypothetical protein